MKAVIPASFAFLILSACAQNPEISKPKLDSASSRSITQIYGGDTIYVVYAKDKNGTPTGIVTTSGELNPIQDGFKKHTHDISVVDCIGIHNSPKDGHAESVCDESQWASFYTTEKTFLMTRKAKNAVDAVFDGALGLAFSPLGLAVDALSGDSSMKHTKGMLTGSTVITPDYDTLAQVRRVIDSLATESFLAQKRAAEQDLGNAAAFLKKFPKTAFQGTERSGVIRANIEREYALKSESGLIRIIDSMVETADERDFALSRLRTLGTFQAYSYALSNAKSQSETNSALAGLRGLGTFQAYSHAFKTAGAEEDAKNAILKAAQPDQKKMAEYMFLKVLEARSPENVTKLFTVRSSGEVRNDGLSSSERSGFFVRATRDGTSNFESNAQVSADKSAGIFEYGTYDVTVRATVHVPQYIYQRSNWVGSRDDSVTSTTSSDIVVRLSPPDYTGAKSISVNNVVLTRLERGSAGGITQIQQTGDPWMTLEVVSAKPVE